MNVLSGSSRMKQLGKRSVTFWVTEEEREKMVRRASWMTLAEYAKKIVMEHVQELDRQDDLRRYQESITVQPKKTRPRAGARGR